jgi:hypothetical protein
MQPNADPEEYIQALHGLEFPASRSQIVNKARDKGGLDTEVIAMFERLPDRTYENAQDLRGELVRAYRAGVPPAGEPEPAAPSPFSDDEKDLIRTMADPRRGDLDDA